MITLKTLPKATEQAVFDQVAKHLLTQRKRSVLRVSGKTKCVYHADTGLKCAAGCLISKKEYREDFENHSWGGLIDQFDLPETHRWLINCLQAIHDEKHPNTWKRELKQLATTRKLNWNHE